MFNILGSDNAVAYFGIAPVIQGEKFYGETSVFATKLFFSLQTMFRLDFDYEFI